MLSETTDGLLRLPSFLRAMPIRTGTINVSAGQVASLLSQAENAAQIATKLVEGRSPIALTTSLESTSWSAAQCLDHLAQTTNAFLPSISSAIARAPRLTTNRALRTGALTRLFIRNLEPPYRLRFKVLAPLIPVQRDFDCAWGAFQESQAQLVKTIQSATGLAIDEVKVESTVYARLSYNVYGALRMLLAHERRHLWQIDQILKTLDSMTMRNAS